LKTRPVVFVSHRGDAVFIQALRTYLSNCDVVVSDWRDRSGDSVAEKVREDISNADLVIILLTESAFQSHWVQQEIGFALGRGRKVIPVFDPEASFGKQLPAFLAGTEWERYSKTAPAESALRTAVRASQLLQEDLVKVFRTYWDYRQWWATVDPRDYTADRCYWATPHDTWSWLMAHSEEEQREVPYKTLIRGDLDFDLRTVKAYYETDEAVCGVHELSAIQEVVVFGNLSFEIFWEPDFWSIVDDFLRGQPSGEELISWHSDFSHRPTRIEVRMNMDSDRAAGHRRRLDVLFKRHTGPPAS